MCTDFAENFDGSAPAIASLMTAIQIFSSISFAVFLKNRVRRDRGGFQKSSAKAWKVSSISMLQFEWITARATVYFPDFMKSLIYPLISVFFGLVIRYYFYLLTKFYSSSSHSLWNLDYHIFAHFCTSHFSTFLQLFCTRVRAKCNL